MKKLFYLFFIISAPVLAQKKSVKISDKEIGPLSCSYSMLVNLETKDTTHYVYIGFQNSEYQHITDIKSIIFRGESGKAELVDDLKVAIPEIGKKISVNWDRENYQLNIFDFNNKMYLYEKSKSGRGHCELSKKNAENLLTWLESFKIGQ